MIPLASDSLPETTQGLENSILAGLRKRGITPKSVSAIGDLKPDLEALKADFSDSLLPNSVQPFEKGVATGAKFSVQELEIRGASVRYQSLPVDIRIHANAVTLSVRQTPQESFLATENLSQGSLDLEASMRDLEKFLSELATKKAAENGVQILETHLTAQATGTRSLQFNLEVLAKVFVVKAPVSLAGNVAVTDALELVFSNLQVGGSAMAVGLVTRFARPKLDELERQPISLAAFSLGDARLKNVSFAAGERLSLHADFGI